jgi:hypothetical protein
MKTVRRAAKSPTATMARRIRSTSANAVADGVCAHLGGEGVLDCEQCLAASPLHTITINALRYYAGARTIRQAAELGRRPSLTIRDIGPSAERDIQALCEHLGIRPSWARSVKTYRRCESCMRALP